jgi:NADH-quinone oxidoreductase subunit G
MPASWEKALEHAGTALGKAGGRAAALAGGETSNEEAFLLQRLFREGLGSSHLSSRSGGELPLDVERALASPALGATVPDLEFAHTVVLLECDPVDDAPILELRIRKGVRRHHVRLAIASARPTALDARADVVERIPPGGGAALLVSLADEDNAFARSIAEAGEDIVIVYGERLLSGPNGEVAAKALLNLAARLGLADRPGAGLLEIPSTMNGRGLRESGFAPGHGPGFATLAEPGRGAAEIAAGLADADLSVLYLLHADPLRTHPDRGLWKAALGTAQTVIAHESVMTETVREFADVVFPAEAYAEKEGTLTHPDGRLQRLRTAIGRPQPSGVGGGEFGVRPGWQVIADVAERAGHGARVAAGPIASRLLFEAVPFYAGLTLDEIGGQGVRWQERDEAARFDAPAWEPVALKAPRSARAAKGALRLGTYRSLWSSKEVDVSPALHFLRPQQIVELSPVDAKKLGIAEGDRVEVGSNGTRVRGAVRLREAVPKGSVFLADGTRQDGANALTEALVEIARIGGPEVAASAAPAQVAPAAEGAEMLPSAPLAIPPTGPSQSGHGA